MLNNTFEEAIKKQKELQTQKQVIGVQNEKTLHQVLKCYYSDNENEQEILIGNHYADICQNNHIYEIQTSQLGKLKEKLKDYLDMEYDVTVVFPIPHKKKVVWIDPDTGVVSGERLSPKKGKVEDVLLELWNIIEYLGHPKFELRVLLINMDEYHLQNGYGKDHKKHSTKVERVPLELVGEICFQKKEDYLILLKNELPASFSAKTFAKVYKYTKRQASFAMSVLKKMALVAFSHKDGREYIYLKKETI